MLNIKLYFRGVQKNLASVKKDFTGYPFLQELAEREEMVRNGKLTVPTSFLFFSFSFFFFLFFLFFLSFFHLTFPFFISHIFSQLYSYETKIAKAKK